MNLIPLAALFLATLALAVAILALVTANRPRRYLSSPAPRFRGPLMRDAARRRHSVDTLFVQEPKVHLSDITTTTDPAAAAILVNQIADRQKGRHL